MTYPALLPAAAITMTSLEISKATGKDHKHVLADIRSLLDQLQIDSAGFSAQYKDSTGRTLPMFTLPRRECDILMMGYSAVMRAAVYDRWQELEARTTPKQITHLETARMLVGALEKVEALEAQALIAAPAVAFVERYVEAKSSKCLSDVAKILGWKPHAFIAELAADGVIFKRAGSWIPYAHQLDNERFTVQTGEANGHAFHQTRVDPAGIAWLAQKYGKKAG